MTFSNNTDMTSFQKQKLKKLEYCEHLDVGYWMLTILAQNKPGEAYWREVSFVKTLKVFKAQMKKGLKFTPRDSLGDPI